MLLPRDRNVCAHRKYCFCSQFPAALDMHNGVRKPNRREANIINWIRITDVNNFRPLAQYIFSLKQLWMCSPIEASVDRL